MIQIRPGDLIAVRREKLYVLYAVLTKQVLFGGHWCFVVHHGRETLPKDGADERIDRGFNAFVDFIVPKREERVFRLSAGNEFSLVNGPELLKQAREQNYRIWRWKDSQRQTARNLEFVRVTSAPSEEERRAPHYGCLQADFASDLAIRAWTPDQSMWTEIGSDSRKD